MARLLALSVASLAALLIGCSDDAGRAPTQNGGGAPPAPTTDPACSTPAPGCPCSLPGDTATCVVRRESGKYVSCSEGTLRCGDGKFWGACEGAATIWGETDAGAD